MVPLIAEEELVRRTRAIAEDHTSGASALAQQAVDILGDSQALGAAVVARIARGLCRAQPAMAAIRNAAALAVDPDGGAALRRLGAWVARAPSAMSTVLTRLLLPDVAASDPPALALATTSHSGSVRACLLALADVSQLRVMCTEGRPMYEGRALATTLAEAGVAVTLCTDAAVGVLVRGSTPVVDAVVVGADAVTPDWFLNKCGTHLLTAAAASVGVPVYVVAGRSSFLNPVLSGAVRDSMGPAHEVWATPSAGVNVVNPYFEQVPLEAVSMFVTEIGPVGIGSVPRVCESLLDSDAARRALAVLGEV